MKKYAKAIQELLKQGETIEDLNQANHIALETRKITLDEFREAAQILAQAFLNR